MSTATEFPEIHWDTLRETMESGGPAAVQAFIGGFNDEERMKLYGLAQRGFGGREWKGKNFDDYIAVVRGGIAEALRQSETAATPERAAAKKDSANILSFNMAADLAECWPGDEVPRERRHIEAGLSAADDCVRWREELGKPADRRAMAEWAQGMHRLSLGDAGGAAASFGAATGHVAEHAAAGGAATSIGPDASFDLNLYTGYLALARMAQGSAEGRDLYTAVRDAFAAQAAQEENNEMRENATFGMAQLEVVERRMKAEG